MLVITTFGLDEYAVEALRAGAGGFLLKDATSAELVRAVRIVAAGDGLLAPTVTRRLLDKYGSRPPPATARTAAAPATITKRELAVLFMIAQGRSSDCTQSAGSEVLSGIRTWNSAPLADGAILTCPP